jgi:branched-chain amino acid aminotransferase
MSMSDRDGLIWYDGKLVPWRNATTHVLTHSLHYGLSVFEGLRAYHTAQGPAIFRLQAHTRRLFDSAHIYQIPIPYNMETLYAAQCEVVRANQLQSCYLRPLVFYGSESMSITPPDSDVHVAIAAWPWATYLGEKVLTEGIRVKVSSYARQHVNVTMPRAKVATTYANSILAHAEAVQSGYDEALLLDTDGFVAEGAVANLFIVRDSVIYEPEPASALTGITRSTIHALATDLGISLVTRRITRDDVYLADEAFFTGTAAEITPIREVDNRRIGKGPRGPITERLQKAYFDVVRGHNAHYRHWLTWV